MLSKKKQPPTDYNIEEYQQFLDTLVLEKNATGCINEAKLIGPLFWKNAMVKAGLVEEDVLPMQFQSQLKLTECVSCKKCFARYCFIYYCFNSFNHNQITKSLIVNNSYSCNILFILLVLIVILLNTFKHKFKINYYYSLTPIIQFN